jgi:hypothetical protein
MAFIVSLFKYIIIGFCFLLLVGIFLGIIFLLSYDGGMSAGEKVGIIAAFIGGLIFLVLNLGGIAILISLHDRHRELAEGVHRIADLMVSYNNSEQIK